MTNKMYLSYGYYQHPPGTMAKGPRIVELDPNDLSSRTSGLTTSTLNRRYYVTDEGSSPYGTHSARSNRPNSHYAPGPARTARLYYVEETSNDFRDPNRRHGRPWREVNSEISSRMVAAASDSPPIIPKRDYDDSPTPTHSRNGARSANRSRTTPNRQRQHTPDIAYGEEVDDSPHRTPSSGPMLNYAPPGPYGPPPMFYAPPAIMGAPVPHTWPPEFPLRPPMPPGMVSVPTGPEGPDMYGTLMPPPFFGPYPPMDFVEIPMPVAPERKKHKKAKRSKSLDALHMRPPLMAYGFDGIDGPMAMPSGPPIFVPGPPPFLLPPPPPVEFAMMPLPGMHGPVPYPQSMPMLMPPPHHPMGMTPPRPGSSTGTSDGPTNALVPYVPPHRMNGNAGMANGKHANGHGNGVHKGDIGLINGHAKLANGNGHTDFRKGSVESGDLPQKPKERSACYLVCCQGFTAVIWIIIGIILVGLILGLVLGLTLV